MHYNVHKINTSTTYCHFKGQTTSCVSFSIFVQSYNLDHKEFKGRVKSAPVAKKGNCNTLNQNALLKYNAMMAKYCLKKQIRIYSNVRSKIMHKKRQKKKKNIVGNAYYRHLTHVSSIFQWSIGNCKGKLYILLL